MLFISILLELDVGYIIQFSLEVKTQTDVHRFLYLPYFDKSKIKQKSVGGDVVD
jgi:hypothetical protein